MKTMCSLKSDRHSRKSNVAWCLLKRQQSQLSCEEQSTISRYGVSQTILPRRARSCKFSGTPQSTYFLAFSPDGETIASCHNDHSVRVSDVKTGRCLQVLNGHPRSPWCVVFHPSMPHLLASGCLDGVVKVWDLTLNDKVIASLSCPSVTSLAFHPTDMVLLIATGNQLWFWSWHQPEPFATVKLESVDTKIRLVKFDSLGHHILTGICDSKPMLVHIFENTDCADPQLLDDSLVCSTSVVCVDEQSVETIVEHPNTAEVAYGRRGPSLVAVSRNNNLYRLQWWDFTRLKIPNLDNRNLNVIAHNCKLYNNASADISADGCLVSALVHQLVDEKELCKVCVFSLREDNLGQCLYSASVGYDTLSTCFSPLGTHLIVGVPYGSRLALFQDASTMAYIFNLSDKSNATFKEVQPLRRVATLKLKKSGQDYLCSLKVNAVLWHPLIEYGLIAVGTNKGPGKCLCHSSV